MAVRFASVAILASLAPSPARIPRRARAILRWVSGTLGLRTIHERQAQDAVLSLTNLEHMGVAEASAPESWSKAQREGRGQHPPAPVRASHLVSSRSVRRADAQRSAGSYPVWFSDPTQTMRKAQAGP